MQNFRTFQLAKELYQKTRKLGLKGEMRDQLERATLSIAANIAEGSGKASHNDRKRFFQIAMGSLRESQGLLELIEQEELQKLADRLGASLFRLLQKPGIFPEN